MSTLDPTVNVLSTTILDGLIIQQQVEVHMLNVQSGAIPFGSDDATATSLASTTGWFRQSSWTLTDPTLNTPYVVTHKESGLPTSMVVFQSNRDTADPSVIPDWESTSKTISIESTGLGCDAVTESTAHLSVDTTNTETYQNVQVILSHANVSTSVTLVRTGDEADYSATGAPISISVLNECMHQSFRNNLTNYFLANGSGAYDDVQAVNVEREHTLVKMEDALSSTNRFMSDQSQAGTYMFDSMTGTIRSSQLSFTDTSAAQYLYGLAKSITLTFDKATTTYSSGLTNANSSYSLPFTNVIDSVSAYLGFGSYDQSEADIRDGFQVHMYAQQSRDASMTMFTSANNQDFSAGLSIAHLSISDLADLDGNYQSICSQLDKDLVLSLTPGTASVTEGDGRLAATQSSIIFNELKFTDVSGKMTSATSGVVSAAFDVDAQLIYNTSLTITNTDSAGATTLSHTFTETRAFSLADTGEYVSFNLDLTKLHGNPSMTAANISRVNNFSIGVTNLFADSSFNDAVIDTPFVLFEKVNNDTSVSTWQQSAASGVNVTGALTGDDSLNYYICIGSSNVKVIDMTDINDTTYYTNTELNTYLEDLGDETAGDLAIAYDQSKFYLSVTGVNSATNITTTLKGQAYAYAVIQNPTASPGGAGKLYITGSTISGSDTYLSTGYGTNGVNRSWRGLGRIRTIRLADTSIDNSITLTIKAHNNQSVDQTHDDDTLLDFIVDYSVNDGSTDSLLFQSGDGYNKYQYDSGTRIVKLPLVIEAIMYEISFKLLEAQNDSLYDTLAEVPIASMIINADAGFQDLVHVIERVRADINVSAGETNQSTADILETSYVGTITSDIVRNGGTISCANSTAGTDYLVSVGMPALEFSFVSASGGNVALRARHLDQSDTAMNTTNIVSQLYTSEVPTVVTVDAYTFTSLDSAGLIVGSSKVNSVGHTLDLAADAELAFSDANNTYTFQLNTDDLNLNAANSNMSASLAVTALYYENYLDHNDNMYIYGFRKNQMDIDLALANGVSSTVILESTSAVSQHLGSGESVSFYNGMFNVAILSNDLDGPGTGSNPKTINAFYTARSDLSVGYNVGASQMYGRSTGGGGDTHGVQYNSEGYQQYTVTRNSRELLSMAVTFNAGTDSVGGSDTYTAPNDSMNLFVSASQVRYSFYNGAGVSVSDSYQLVKGNGATDNNVLSTTILRGAADHVYGDFYYLELDETAVTLPRRTLGDRMKIVIDESDNNVAAATSRSSVADFALQSACSDRVGDFLSSSGISAGDIGDLYNILYQVKFKSPLGSNNQAASTTAHTMFVNPDRVNYVDYHSGSTQASVSTTLFNLNPSSSETLDLLNVTSRKQIRFTSTIPGAHLSTVDSKAIDYYFLEPQVKLYTWANTFAVALEESINATYDVTYNGETLLNDNLSGGNTDVVGYTAANNHKTGLRFYANQANHLYDVDEIPGTLTAGTRQYYRDYAGTPNNVQSVAVWMKYVSTLSTAGATVYSSNVYSLTHGTDYVYVSSGSTVGYIKIKEIVFDENGVALSSGGSFLYASDTGNNNSIDDSYNIFIRTLDDTGTAIYFHTFNNREIQEFTLSGIKGDRFATQFYVYRGGAWSYVDTCQDVVLYGISQQGTDIDLRDGGGTGNYLGIRLQPRLAQIESDESYSSVIYMKHYNVGEGFAIVTVSGPPTFMIQSRIQDTIPTQVSIVNNELSNTTSTAAVITQVAWDVDLHLTGAILQDNLRSNGLSDLSSGTILNYSQET